MDLAEMKERLERLEQDRLRLEEDLVVGTHAAARLAMANCGALGTVADIEKAERWARVAREMAGTLAAISPRAAVFDPILEARRGG
jgi:hypothetical protein